MEQKHRENLPAGTFSAFQTAQDEKTNREATQRHVRWVATQQIERKKSPRRECAESER